MLCLLSTAFPNGGTASSDPTAAPPLVPTPPADVNDHPPLQTEVTASVEEPSSKPASLFDTPPSSTSGDDHVTDPLSPSSSPTGNAPHILPPAAAATESALTVKLGRAEEHLIDLHSNIQSHDENETAYSGYS